jgi:hypothetical protein
MERLNLNVPSDTRAALKRLAAAAKRKEAELARELLVDAVAEAERDEFFQAMERGMTPVARKRLAAIAGALEKLSGSAR